MSSNKEAQEAPVVHVETYSIPQTTNAATIYPSPPPSPPRTDQDSPITQRELENQPCPGATTSALASPPRTPRRNLSNFTHKEETPAGNIVPMNASVLKAALLLNQGKSGCFKKDGEPCRRLTISDNNRGQIDKQIKAMVAFTQSSPTLETELQKLVMLVHCYQHRSGNSKVSRIETWKAVFPMGEDRNKLVESVGRQIKKALGQVSAQCPVERELGKRCEKSIGGQRVHNIARTIGEIIQPATYMNDTCVEGLLEVLHANMYCDDHVSSRPTEKVEAWKRAILEIRKQVNWDWAQAVQIETSEVGLESQTRESGKLSNQISDTLTLQIQSPATPRSSRSVSMDFTRDPATFWPVAYDTTPFEIIPRENKRGSYESPYNLIKKKILNPLNEIDQKSGFVYLYEVEGNKGFVKIGYTTDSVATRHKDWTFVCNREAKQLYPIQSGSAMTIPSARRVEALCHAELDHCRVKINCRACLKPHIEWFETSSAEAIKVIEKWSRWMMTFPYQSPRELRSGVKWSLKEEERLKTHNLNRFMEDISTAAETTVVVARP